VTKLGQHGGSGCVHVAREVIAEEPQNVTVFLNHPDLGEGYSLYGRAMVTMVHDDETNGLVIAWVPDDEGFFYRVEDFDNGE
jgi:hypothetical protein